MRKPSFLIAALALLLPAVATGAEKRPEVAGSAAALLKCRGEANEVPRLRCFDDAAAALAAELQSGATVVIDQETMRKTRNSLFGLDIDLPDFGGKDEPAPKEVVASVRSIRVVGHGMWQIQLDGGALWETTEATRTLAPPCVGEKVKIRKSAGGGYMLHHPQRLIRARRVR